MRGPLKGKHVFVEIFDEEDNISSAFHSLVTSLGGTIATNFNKKVNYLVWRRGRQRIWLKAKEYDITTVTPLWLEACEREGTLANKSAFSPPEPRFELLAKRTRQAFTSPGRNLPVSKRQKPVPATTKKDRSPMMSGMKAKIDFSDTSASSEDDTDHKVFLCGEPDSEIDAEMRLVGAKLTSKPGSADIAVVASEEAVQSIAAAMMCKLKIVGRKWLKESCDAQTWLSPEAYRLTEYELQATLFSALRFAVDESLQAEGFAVRLLGAGGGTVVSHPREGDYYVTESSPPRLPSHIKVVTPHWLARCLTHSSILPEN